MLECESYMIDLHIEIFIVLYLILISIFYFTIFKQKNFSFHKKWYILP